MTTIHPQPPAVICPTWCGEAHDAEELALAHLHGICHTSPTIGEVPVECGPEHPDRKAGVWTRFDVEADGSMQTLVVIDSPPLPDGYTPEAARKLAALLVQAADLVDPR